LLLIPATPQIYTLSLHDALPILDAAELLVKHGAKVDARERWGGQTALMWASARRHPQMMQFLISKGADVNARSIDRDYQRHDTRSEEHTSELQSRSDLVCRLLLE